MSKQCHQQRNETPFWKGEPACGLERLDTPAHQPRGAILPLQAWLRAIGHKSVPQHSTHETSSPFRYVRTCDMSLFSSITVRMGATVQARFIIVGGDKWDGCMEVAGEKLFGHFPVDLVGMNRKLVW